MKTLIATCPEEIKPVLKDELKDLGAVDLTDGYRAVQFSVTGSQEFYDVHLHLRTASRIMQVLGTVRARSVASITKQVQNMPWPKIFSGDIGYKVDGIAGNRGSTHLSSNDISKGVRLGIESAFAAAGCERPKVDLKNPRVIIVAFLRDGRLTLSFDTSGKSLHKRGYRSETHPAPLKETLAASILRLAGFDGSQILFDPMCGSGTIAIEAAMLALGKAPLIHRKRGDFGFEWAKNFNNHEWRKCQDRSRLAKKSNLAAPIFAADIDSTFVHSARQNALKGRVERHINFSIGDFFTSSPPAASGLLVTNLPYGERIQEGEALKDFYVKFGDTLKRKYPGWRAVVLAATEAPHKYIGLKPSKRVTLLNGSIPCKLLFFDLYSGSRKQA